MEFNRNNYEIYMLDYIEGNLTLDIRADFICFLDNNPDLKEEAEDLLESNLVAEPIVFQSKHLLKKNANNDIEGLTRFEQLSIAKIENDIDLNENKQLDELLSNSNQKRLEFQTFQKLKLIPDISITFPDKNKLKHRNSTIYLQRISYVSSIAALILLLFGIGIFYQPENTYKNGKNLYNSNISNYLLRQPSQIETVQYHYNLKQLAINNQVVFEIPPRDSSRIEPITMKQIVAIENSKQNAHGVSIEDLPIRNTSPIVKSNENYLSFGEYLNKQFKEKILNQPANEKTTLASVGNAFGRVLSKVFKKEISIDKQIMDDGSKLYAFKAGSFEIYTNIKSTKKAEHLSDEKSNGNSKLLKE